MGERALVQFRDEDGREISPVVYLHWSGPYIGEYLAECRELMKERGPDVSYAAARFVGICHNHNPGALSLGMWNQQTEITKEDSHGDAGCFVVHLMSDGEWVVETCGGYGLHKDRDLFKTLDQYREAKKAAEAPKQAERACTQCEGSIDATGAPIGRKQSYVLCSVCGGGI